VSVPGWYELILLALAAWRSWHLLAYDDILNRPRRWLFRVPPSWKEGDPPAKGARYKLVEWAECPFCSGWWTALVWWAAWQLWPHGTLVVAVAFALGAGVVAVHKVLSAD
jgi:hypothetical protein